MTGKTYWERVSSPHSFPVHCHPLWAHGDKPMEYLIVVAVVLAGIGQPLQAAMNARLRESAGSPAFAASLSFVVGGLALAILTLSGVLGRGTLSGLAQAPWWAWLGSLSGAFSVITALVAVRRVSTAGVIVAAILGQCAASLAIDHFGCLGVPRIPIDARRVIGAILLFAGVLLIQHGR
jgi:transporter family-2 protein